MRPLLAAALVAAASPALADATVPGSTPAQSRAWMFDDELVTHGPPPGGTRAEPPLEAPVSMQPPAPAPTRGRATSAFEDGHCVDHERDTSGPDHPLDFVDATIESGDLASRFKSARPVVKQAPAPRRTKVLREK